MHSAFDTDVFVAGGGPAGLAAAVAAHRKGFRVTVADGVRPPIDKACGEGLLPESISSLAELGIAIPPEESFPFRGIRFLGRGGRVEADFRSGNGAGVRRTVLHRTLLECAQRAGITLLWGTPVTGIGPGFVSLGGRKLTARWIIGADGTRSRVRAWSGLDAGLDAAGLDAAGLDASQRGRVRFGFRRHYRVRPWTPYMEVYWGAGLQAYMTAVAENEICLAVISRDPHVHLDDALDQFPELCRRLDGAEVVSTERGSATEMRRLPAVSRGSVALVGDASGSVDAITGIGLGLAFRQAVLVADAMERSDLRRYQSEHRRMARRPWLMAELLLSMDRWPRIGARARKVLSARPELFERLLAVHTGQLAPLAQARTHATLGLRMLLG